MDDRNDDHSTRSPDITVSDPWKHRSINMCCRTCMWNVPKEPGVLVTGSGELMTVIGRCRRHAPTMNGYPVVYAHDWCGDHKLDENKLT